MDRDEFDEPQEKSRPRVKLTLEEFEEANPDIAVWWTGSDFDFAINLREYVRKNGKLTDRQFAAAMKCAKNFADSKAAQEHAATNAQSVNIASIEQAFRKAQRNKIQKPKVRLLIGDDTFVLHLAPLHSRNAGAIYVSWEEMYLGKIKDGKFIRSRECGDAFEKMILEVCNNPEQAAVAYGRRFGTCSCCGRELTNALSIELGIGPICRSNFFG
jgi:hypothetical protein